MVLARDTVRHQAALHRRDVGGACASPPRCRPSSPAAISTARSTRSAFAVLHELPRRGARAAYDPQGVRKLRPRPCASSTPTARRPNGATGAVDFSALGPRTRNAPSRSGATSRSTSCARRWRDAWWRNVPVGPCCSPGAVDPRASSSGSLAEAGQSGCAPYLDRLRGGERGEGATNFRLFPDLIREALRTDHTQIFIPSTDMPRGVPRHDPRDVGADGLLRQCRLLPASRGGGEARQGRAVGAGGPTKIFAGYHWYPKVAGSNDPVGDYALRPSSSRSHARLKPASRPRVAARRRTRPPAPSSRRISPCPAPPTPSNKASAARHAPIMLVERSR